jgi:AcrR family transcriptional regulator
MHDTDKDAAPAVTEPAVADPDGKSRGGRPPAPKSEQTRALILQTAMRLFEERGYDRTTMRAIAKEAGVSVGNAYYYFGSKEHLIQGFYDRMSHDHARMARAALAGRTDFGERLDIALGTWLDCASPFHEFAAQFFRNAADPDSPLSPFSEESHPARAVAVEIWRDVLMESEIAPKIDTELAEMLPDILWLHQMGMVLYWVFDRSPDQQRTRDFARRCTPIVAKLVNLSRYRVFRPLLRDAKALIRDFIVPTLAARVPGAGGR